MCNYYYERHYCCFVFAQLNAIGIAEFVSLQKLHKKLGAVVKEKPPKEEDLWEAVQKKRL
jgi:hypothetical protein